MKRLRALAACALILNCMRAFGGVEQSRFATATEEFNPQRFEFAIESAFLFGAINPPASYEIGAEFLTARVRWGVVRSDSWLRGYHQFYLSAVLEDSHPEVPGGQGQDFTFNILSAAGISYNVNDHWKIDVGALYQHLSNGGQTDPNPSVNLFGPQVGVTYSF
ncbi:MAG: hypothetical protein DMF01_09040 [Verrucomicrobia bacterium]|nr:MAG: hypothetical protein DMF01_09040 [Verrucomicrobiota bacterium]